ncbi:TULIP family P47-like protein [Cytobacillus sp. IB215316]|nr:TULIP family P47-like protein [Cytobacillus sp. IB215316]MDX8362984.1 TULIP family P47-like protein [Cytobacillus sp. IB215316]
MDTMGWDSLYVCSIDRINKQLKNNMNQVITDFSFVKKDPEHPDGDVEIHGVFNPWQIELNGSNSLLWFSTPIKSGSLKIGSNNVYDISGINPIMEMQLHFINSALNVNSTELTFNVQIKGEKVGDSTVGAVTTVEPDSTNKINSQTSLNTWSMLKVYLPELFIENKEKLSYVFSNINFETQNTKFNWLAPKQVNYVYKKPSHMNEGYLSILGLTSHDDPTQLKDDIDPTLLDNKNGIFMLISNKLFLKHIIMPELADSFGNGATSSNFIYQGINRTNGKIKNKGSLSCGSIKKGLETYHPKITDLTISVSDNYLISKASGKFAITGLANASVTFTITSKNKCEFNSSEMTINFIKDPKPKVKYSKHIPWYDWVVSSIGGPIVIGIVDLVMATVTNAVSKSVSKSLALHGGTSFLGNLGVDFVTWTGSNNNFVIKDAGLSQSFYIKGDYVDWLDIAQFSTYYCNIESVDDIFNGNYVWKVTTTNHKNVLQNIHHKIDKNPKKKTYTFSVWMKSDVEHTVTLRLRNNEKTEQLDQSVSVGNDWRQYKVTVPFKLDSECIHTFLYPAGKEVGQHGSIYVSNPELSTT